MINTLAGYFWFRSLPNVRQGVLISEDMKLVVASLAILLAIACGSAAPGPGGQALTVDQLKFRVMDAVGTPVYCDPDYYPVVREGGEQANAISTYPEIRDQADLYAAIVAHEHLPVAGLSDAQKLTVYRAFKLLRALTLTRNDIFQQPGGAPGSEYTFDYRAQSPTSIQLVSGTVSFDGAVTVKLKTPSGPPPCPICLAANTLIATPDGDVRVVDVRAGMLVWTASLNGRRVASPVVEIGSTPVPAGHVMVGLRLADGRELLASPGHQTADGRPLGSLAVGDGVDGSTVTRWELVPYSGDRTYDLLPAGSTGTYWANGIPLSSTLAP